MIINNLIINNSLDEILQELQNQLQARGIHFLEKTRDSGDNIMVQCPYHGNGQERKPSAGIHKETGVFHCFACGEKHSLSEVISYCFGYNDILGKYGTKWLVENFVTMRKEERKGVEINMERRNFANKGDVLDSSDSNQYNTFVTEEELDKYRYYHQYWKERGIYESWIYDLFDIGWDPQTDCITFPMRDVKGNCLFVARRSTKSKWFNYPQGVEKPLYGLYELSKIIDYRRGNHKNHLFITESMIDCLLLWQAGKYAVALNGTGNKLQLNQLNQLPIRHYILCTDNDKAGSEAREKLRKYLKGKLITEIKFPEGIKDIGDLGEARRFGDIKTIERWEVF